VLVVSTVRTEMEPKLNADMTISIVARPIEVPGDFIERM
jgi:hypothetical protein